MPRLGKPLIYLLIGLLAAGLLSCQPPEKELPGVARMQIVLAQNQMPKPVYFLEDTTHNRVNFELYYFDASGSFLTLSDKPQFLVNGQPFAGSSYIFTRAGQYTFTARLNNRVCDNQLDLRVSPVREYIDHFVLSSFVPVLNADSVSQLPLSYQLITKQGEFLDPLAYASPRLRADGKELAESNYFATGQAGIHTLQATFLGMASGGLDLTARRAVTYPLVRLPVVIHLAQNVDSLGIDPAKLLAGVNRLYRKAQRTIDPNQADSFLEFYPAPIDPGGRPLALAGLHRLAINNPATREGAVAAINALLQQWCPQRYINVVMGIDWARLYSASRSYAYLPNLPQGPSELTCEDLVKANWSSPPAIYLSDPYQPSILSHELGHFLGLPHTFSSSCPSGPAAFTDLPKHLEALPDASGLKYSCDTHSFRSEYAMDYYVPQLSFTYDQVKLMRRLVEFGGYIPRSPPPAGRRRRTQPIALESGHILF
ncbi:M43 family zinc metalloprotease [Fibrella forsythiae]|uniref:Peptidase M43 pregnancy-associated plasma-A domain-containing protein n=1 Tax=Fibrella forsythiae TaxID=2817061 RepID=A0ABS3JWK5_9BACT|nr:M43 family zinc metalloprotease [Fibrella forsythiae]MBO0953282.1 hypothetical protein [Fibrella forsythiae]